MAMRSSNSLGCAAASCCGGAGTGAFAGGAGGVGCGAAAACCGAVGAGVAAGGAAGGFAGGGGGVGSAAGGARASTLSFGLGGVLTVDEASFLTFLVGGASSGCTSARRLVPAFDASPFVAASSGCSSARRFFLPAFSSPFATTSSASSSASRRFLAAFASSAFLRLGVAGFWFARAACFCFDSSVAAAVTARRARPGDVFGSAYY